MTHHPVLGEIEVEMQRQLDLWGEQNHPSVTQELSERHVDRLPYIASVLPDYGILRDENYFKALCESAASNGRLTYAHIMLEEMAEVVDADGDEKRREELVQLAAVCASWIEAIDRRLPRCRTCFGTGLNRFFRTHPGDANRYCPHCPAGEKAALERR
jgi:hypothetical protein